MHIFPLSYELLQSFIGRMAKQIVSDFSATIWTPFIRISKQAGQDVLLCEIRKSKVTPRAEDRVGGASS
uniref:Uncharacterized protein n=1 Tax=Anguilla anguilla TaxID=7936 RepID=A0A0E9R055_ANGAN